MNFRILLIFLIWSLIFIVKVSFPQVITFDRTYSQFGDSVLVVSIQQETNGDYFVSGYNGKNLFIAKIDTIGNILWHKEYNTYHRPSLPPYNLILGTSPYYNYSNIVIKPNKEMFAVSTQKVLGEDATDMLLLKLDQYGDTIWTKTYNFENYNEMGFNIYETMDGGFIIGTAHISFSLKSIIFKIDSDANLEWAKRMSGSTKSNVIKQLSQNCFIVSGRAEILIIDQHGIIIWERSFDYSVYGQTVTKDHQIYVLGSKTIEKLDSMGITIWKRNYDRTAFNNFSEFQEIQAITNGGIIVTGRDENIYEFDAEGNILSEKGFFPLPVSIIETIDLGFTFASNISTGIYVLKTDRHVNFNLLKFELGNAIWNHELNIEDCATIRWFSSGINKINLDYSVDNSTSWLNILSDFPVNDGWGVYQWDTPDIIKDSILIRINDPDKLQISDTVIISTIHDTDWRKGYNFIAANEVKMWIGNNGDGSHNPRSDGSGLFWPGGNCASVASVFEDGLVYGGIVDEKVNVNGSTYRQGWQPGNILEGRTAADPNDPKFKVWKIKKNWESLLPSPIRDEFEYDYNNWPVEYGAPWQDINKNGLFERGIDTPKFLGDEVLFHVSNDLDPEVTKNVYGSPPIGLEFKVTVWAHNTSDFLRDVVFKKYDMINKSGKTINDMYFSYWADNDLGNASDDFVGCDSLLNLAFSYNADNNDQEFYGLNPPSCGHMLLQGPIVTAELTDSAKFNYSWKKGYKNLELTSFNLLFEYAQYYDPEFGLYSGSLEFYNIMKGVGYNGNPYINPNTGDTTTFCLSGDPVNGSGWLDGLPFPAGFSQGDRRYNLSSGPFNVEPGDTQEVVFAIFMARGSDNIQSVAELKYTARAIQDYWDNIIYTDVEDEYDLQLPTRFELSQNYPNPFNPTTTIKYSIPHGLIPSGDEGWLVQLSFYDILGREVKTLVNKLQKPGNYTVEFDASNLTSGVYFYRLKSGDFVKTRKMLLLK